MTESNEIYAAALMDMTKGLEDGWVDTNVSDPEDIGRVGVVAAENVARNLSPADAYQGVVAMHKAVSVKARNLSKARWRLFDANTEEEIIGGPAWEFLRNPAPKLSMQQLTYTTVSTLNIQGEFAVYLWRRRGDDYPSMMLPIDPGRLKILRPSNKPPNSLDEIIQWTYLWHNGDSEDVRADHVIFDRFYNPTDPIRGLSPAVVGAIDIGIRYSAGKYNKDTFDNGNIPSHIVTLGEGVGRQQREDFTRRYLQEFSFARGNAHKAMVASGKDIDVKILDQQKEGSFEALMRMSDEQVYTLYGIPPIEAGIIDKSRYDTANEERKLFVESTLMPEADMLSTAFQLQLIDPHFGLAPTQRKKVELSRGMKQRLERVRYERPDSNVIILLDLDTLPIMASVKAAMIATAKEFKDTLDMSAKELAEYFDIDLPEREERNDVWKLNNYLNISKPEFNAKLQPKAAPGPADATKKPPGPKAAKKSIDPDTLKGAEKVIRKLRKLTFEGLDAGELWSLADADALAESSGLDMKKAIRSMRHHLRTIYTTVEDGEGRTDEVKHYLNRLDIPNLLGFHDDPADLSTRDSSQDSA